MDGIVVCIISNRYSVKLESGEIVVCVAMGKLRKGESPVVGDKVLVIKYDDVYAIEKIYERTNYLRRPLIANVDQAVIVMSACDPEFSSTLIDRLIILIRYADITPKIVVTKMDLLADQSEVLKQIEDYRKSGYEVVLKSDEVALQALFSKRISVLCGQSGAGKSSLLNSIDASLELRTQEISKALGRGKHTTRHVELLEIGDGYIADTPGFSSLEFKHIKTYDLVNYVPDFLPYLGKCRFNDCIHDKEPGCAIKEAVENGKVSAARYNHYLEVLKLCSK